jgi:capsular polysaccharide export protein
MPKAIVHIGAHKTGTTAIQSTLWNSAEALRRSALTYPMELTTPQPHFNSQQCIAYTLLGMKKFSRVARDSDVDPLEYLDALPRDRDLLISSENFMRLNEAQIARLGAHLHGFDVRVILYVRRQDESSQALYQTDVVNRRCQLTFEEYLETNRPLFDYGAAAKRWSGRFGRASLTVRVYERARFANGDAVGDFLGAVEGILGRALAKEGWRAQAADVNAGLPNHVVALIRYFNGVAERDKIVPLLVELSRALYSGARGRYDLIPPSARRSVMSAYQDSNESLARDWLDRAGGKLFSEEAAEESEAEWNRKYGWEGSQLSLLLRDVLSALKDPGAR